MSCRVCIKRSLNLAEIICNNLLPLCNRARETLVYYLRIVPGTFAQIIEVPNLFKGVNVIDIHTLSCVDIFAASSYRGSIRPKGAKIGSSYREFREIEGSRNRG